MRFAFSLLLALSSFIFAANFGVAQESQKERERAILVMDGSGSMWGQIDGIAKITIAQEVVGDLLQQLPDEQELGLTAYGHRRKGDCTDIETLVDPALGTKSQIGAAVNAISPKGKTPMTDAVIAAAESLRYTEEKATVILVSDGIETCAPDPCAAAAALEAAGVDFTAHVVGFDVLNDPEAVAQMQCIARETGGLFLTASNADELSTALETVAESEPEPAPEPEVLQPARLSYAARIEGSGDLVQRDLNWIITDASGAILLDVIGRDDAIDALPGRYLVAATRQEDGMEISQEIALTKSGTRVILEFPPFAPRATISAPAEAPVGSTIILDWTGPDEKNNYISIAKRDDRDSGYFNYNYTSKGPSLELTMPSEPGTYEIRYFMNVENIVIARVPIVATPVGATLDAPSEAPSGSDVAVKWTGPDYRNDYIDVAKVGAGHRDYINYGYTGNSQGNVAQVEMPIEPGTYELRYIMAQDEVVLARRQITVTAETFSVSGPLEAQAGATIAVDWVGPNLSNDYLAVAKPGAPDRDYETYEYTRGGSPAQVTLPMEAGEYEIRYIVAQTDEAMASHRINILPLSGYLSADESVAAGAVFEVAWEGPGYRNDHVAVAEPGSDVTKYVTYEYTRNGPILEVTAPSQPGEYELRLITQSSGRKIVASQKLTVDDVTASLAAPSSAAAGTTINVDWQGPGYRNDYVAIFPKGEERRYTDYSYVRNGASLQLDVPSEAGEYELKYVMGQDRRVLRSVPLKVE